MSMFVGVIAFAAGVFFGPALREAWANWRESTEDDDGDFGA